jgi:hypothetical protein
LISKGEFQGIRQAAMTIQQNSVQPKLKSIRASIILGIIFGPFGILYSSRLIGIIAIAICAIVGIVTAGIGLLIMWPICAMLSWGIVYSEQKAPKQN